MSEINVEIESIVKNIGGEVCFLQPIYEAITNSLEANATNIQVELFEDKQISLNDVNKKIVSYCITDDGDGFTQENIDSFNKLWSAHKMSMGCKGSGRFTWLKIFKNISIISKIEKTSTEVSICFNKNYNKDANKIETNNNIKKMKPWSCLMIVYTQ